MVDEMLSACTWHQECMVLLTEQLRALESNKVALPVAEENSLSSIRHCCCGVPCELENLR